MLILKEEFDSEPVYNKKSWKSKIKYHGDKVTDFYDKEIPKVDSNHTCLAVIILDSALKKDDNYYPKVFLKQYKYIDNLSDISSSAESDGEYIRIGSLFKRLGRYL